MIQEALLGLDPDDRLLKHHRGRRVLKYISLQEEDPERVPKDPGGMHILGKAPRNLNSSELFSKERVPGHLPMLFPERSLRTQEPLWFLQNRKVLILVEDEEKTRRFEALLVRRDHLSINPIQV